MNQQLAQLYSVYSAEKEAFRKNNTPSLLEHKTKEPDSLIVLRNALLNVLNDKNINDIVDDEDKDTLLHVAARANDVELLAALIEKGADINILNINDLSPMQIAIHCLSRGCVLKLYQNGGNIEETDVLGETYLFKAVKYGYAEHVELLLALNANVHAYDKYEKTIIDCLAELMKKDDADQKIKFKIARLLLENYIGIGTDFSGIDLPPGVTDGVPVIFATKDKAPITVETDKFNKIIFNFDDLFNSKSLNFKKLQYLLEKVFKPYFPGEQTVMLYEHNINLRRENGDIRANNFAIAAPELEKIYNKLRIRTAGIQSLKDLASASLLLQHGLKIKKQEPITDPKLTAGNSLILPPDIEERIESLAADIETKLGRDRTGNKSSAK